MILKRSTSSSHEMLSAVSTWGGRTDMSLRARRVSRRLAEKNVKSNSLDGINVRSNSMDRSSMAETVNNAVVADDVFRRTRSAYAISGEGLGLLPLEV
jgi:hypothetical protein